MKNFEIINDGFFDRCTGCGACANICPVGAITIEENSDGFLYPTIDQTKCINCGKCKKTCPANVNNSSMVNNDVDPKCLAVWANDDVRIKCASGGVFGAIAYKFVEEGGFVSGAVYKDINHVEHIVTNKLEDVDKIIGSKYVQSDTKQCFKEIKNLLVQGKKVLFCGCPCQVAGLYRVIGKDNENLYTMDLICHGVPGYKFYRKYLERYPDIESIDFRDKSVFGWSTEINLKLKNGEEIHKRHENDTFYRGFLPCMVQRKSCGTCKYSSLPRLGDLTIGDFWGISNYNAKLNDKKGTSVVLVNNKKGEFLLNNYKKQFSLIKQTPIEIALRVNKNIKQPFKPHFARDRFYRDFDVVNDLDKLVNMSLTSHYDVGIVGLWFGLNFGSVLTYYALYKVINKLGFSAFMINKPNFMWTSRYEDPNTIAQKFIRKHCNVSMVRDKNNLKELSNHCDAFVVGSDVVWNYQICGETAGQFLFLDFVDDKCKKISYASSFGKGYSAPEKEYALSKYYLQKFDAVSVREQEAADICKNQFDVKANLVMDPVFLCDKEKYNEIANDSKVKFPSHFIGSYILGPDQTKSKMLILLKDKYNLPFVILPNPNNNASISKINWGNDKEILYNAEVEDFLACINNSDYFFADSFHGLCFAIIFNKQFVAVTGKYQKDNCRFINLLNTIGEIDKLVFIEDFLENPNLLIEKLEKPVDYDKVNKILNEKAKISIEWLREQLTKEKQPKTNVIDCILDMLNEQSRQILQLKKEKEELDNKLNKTIAKFYGCNFLASDNASDYLLNLSKEMDNKIIFVSVKDTLGLNLNDKIQSLLNNLGIKLSLIKQHWKGYVALIDNGKLIHEKLATNINEGVQFNKKYNGMNVSLTSLPYNSGNKSAIIIDGVDYSRNERGLNIVVYDKKSKQVIDSVSIDTHVDKHVFRR